MLMIRISQRQVRRGSHLECHVQIRTPCFVYVPRARDSHYPGSLIRGSFYACRWLTTFRTTTRHLPTFRCHFTCAELINCDASNSLFLQRHAPRSWRFKMNLAYRRHFPSYFLSLGNACNYRILECFVLCEKSLNGWKVRKRLLSRIWQNDETCAYICVRILQLHVCAVSRSPWAVNGKGKGQGGRGEGEEEVRVQQRNSLEWSVTSVKVLCQCGPRLTCGALSPRIRALCALHVYICALVHTPVYVRMRVHETHVRRYAGMYVRTRISMAPSVVFSLAPSPLSCPRIIEIGSDRNRHKRRKSRARGNSAPAVRVMRVPRAIVIARLYEGLSVYICFGWNLIFGRSTRENIKKHIYKTSFGDK